MACVLARAMRLRPPTFVTRIAVTTDIIWGGTSQHRVNVEKKSRSVERRLGRSRGWTRRVRVLRRWPIVPARDRRPDFERP